MDTSYVWGGGMVMTIGMIQWSVWSLLLLLLLFVPSYSPRFASKCGTKRGQGNDSSLLVLQEYGLDKQKHEKVVVCFQKRGSGFGIGRLVVGRTTCRLSLTVWPSLLLFLLLFSASCYETTFLQRPWKKKTMFLFGRLFFFFFQIPINGGRMSFFSLLFSLFFFLVYYLDYPTPHFFFVSSPKT